MLLTFNFPIQAEGREMTRNIAFLISHQTNDTTDRSAEITYPTDTVKGSERIRIAIIGTIHSTWRLHYKNMSCYDLYIAMIK